MKRVAKGKAIAELFLYAALIVMGVSIICNPWIGVENPLIYIASIYVIFAFFAFIAYFIGRKEEDYELILLSLLNVVMAVLLFYFEDGYLPLLLSFSLSSWAFFYITLKLIMAYQYKDINHKRYSIKMIITSIILFLSVLTIFKLFNDDIMLSLTAYGYYFVVVAALNFLEVTLNTIVYDVKDDNSFKLTPSSLEINDENNNSVKILVEDIEEVTIEEPSKVKKVSTKKNTKTTTKSKSTTKKKTTSAKTKSKETK